MTKNFEQATGVQRRTITELRTAGDEFALVGYAATYNSWSKNLGGFREKLLPGTFARSLKQGADVKALFNHNPSAIFGRTKSGTLQLEDTPKGLRFRCQLDKSSQAHCDLYASVKRGDIDECSFAFTVPEGGDAWTEGLDPDTNQRISLRTLSNVDLLDVSVVTDPAYTQTAVGARSKSRFPIPGSNLDYTIQAMRRAAQSAVKELRRAAREMSQEDFASLGGHMQISHELCEAACAVSGTVRDIIDGCDPDDEDCDQESFRAMNECHSVAHKALAVAAERCAECRLKHSAAAKAMGRSKK